MNNNIKNSIDLIINNVDKSWSKNAKIRYVYIEIGKLLSKDIHFFYTLLNLVKEGSYSEEEILNKREIDYSLINDNYSVICNSSAGLLKYAFDILKIESKVINLINKDTFRVKNNDGNYNVDIRHYFISVIGDNNKSYFLRLMPDLMNIQYGLETEHFARKLTKIRENGEILNAYNGPKINNSVLSNEEIKRLDIEIGYIKKLEDGTFSNYNDDLLKQIDTEYKKIHMLLLYEEVNFYNEAFKYTDSDNNSIDLKETNIFDLNKNQLTDWINHLKILVSNQNNSLSLNLIEKIENQIDFINNNTPLDERKVINKRIYNIICKITETFIDKDYIYNTKNKKEPCTTKYLNHKFELLFPYVFGCNEGRENTITSDFNGIDEINSFIDLILEKLFPEVNEMNSKNIENINKKNNESILKARIHKTNMINKKDNSYSILFLIDNINIVYHFNPFNGEFKKLNSKEQFDIINNNIIISNSIENIIVENDNISNCMCK